MQGERDFHFADNNCKHIFLNSVLLIWYEFNLLARIDMTTFRGQLLDYAMDQTRYKPWTNDEPVHLEVPPV